MRKFSAVIGTIDSVLCGPLRYWPIWIEVKHPYINGLKTTVFNFIVEVKQIYFCVIVGLL